MFLTSELAAAIVPAFQHGGLDNDKYFEVLATCKHFDVHGGPESASMLSEPTLGASVEAALRLCRVHCMDVLAHLTLDYTVPVSCLADGTLVQTNRMTFNSVITQQEWVEMHQPAFESCVKAGVVSVMCRYDDGCAIPTGVLYCSNCSILSI